jgi:hypothetical protein
MCRALDGEEPWVSWACEHWVLATAIAQSSFVDLVPERPSRDLEPLGTEQLLAVDGSHESMDVVRLLERRASADDVRLMLDAARDEDLPMRGPAIEALGTQQRLELVEILAGLPPRPLRPFPLWPYVFRTLRALPYDSTRSLAHEWLESESSGVMHRRATAITLEEHARPDDIAMIDAYLRREARTGFTGDVFVLGHLAGALARHPEHGPYTVLAAVFHGTTYTYGRLHVAYAMAATDREFPRTHASSAYGTATLTSALSAPSGPTSAGRPSRRASERWQPIRPSTTRPSGLLAHDSRSEPRPA